MHHLRFKRSTCDSNAVRICRTCDLNAVRICIVTCSLHSCLGSVVWLPAMGQCCSCIMPWRRAGRYSANYVQYWRQHWWCYFADSYYVWDEERWRWHRVTYCDCCRNWIMDSENAKIYRGVQRSTFDDDTYKYHYGEWQYDNPWQYDMDTEESDASASVCKTQ